MAADSHHTTDGSKTVYETGTCPECGHETDVIHLFGEPPREACPTFCSWDGKTLTEDDLTEVES